MQKCTEVLNCTYLFSQLGSYGLDYACLAFLCLKRAIDNYQLLHKIYLFALC